MKEGFVSNIINFIIFSNSNYDLLSVCNKTGKEF